MQEYTQSIESKDRFIMSNKLTSNVLYFVLGRAPVKPNGILKYTVF